MALILSRPKKLDHVHTVRYEIEMLRFTVSKLTERKLRLGWPDPAKESRFLWINWRTLVNRIQAALIAAERAWQNWVFKSLK